MKKLLTAFLFVILIIFISPAFGSIVSASTTVILLKDIAPPVVHSVTLSTHTSGVLEAVIVTVIATDDTTIVNVTANGVELIKRTPYIWNGTITVKDGSQHVNVSAKDIAGNITWDNSTTYRASTSFNIWGFLQSLL